MLDPQAQPITIGISLKMYFSHARTLAWTTEIAELARSHEAIRRGLASLFVAPTFPALAGVASRLSGTVVGLAAQDIAVADDGPYTGEVSGKELREIGCSIAEIGHSERRALFGEDDDIVATKTLAAIRNELTPLVCVGERARCNAEEAVEETVTQLSRALVHAREAGRMAPLLVAYEPEWAIGADEPAPIAHITAVVDGLQEYLSGDGILARSRVLYGGSARPGLLRACDGRVKGLFLGRFAHDPVAVRAILDEVSELVSLR